MSERGEQFPLRASYEQLEHLHRADTALEHRERLVRLEERVDRIDALLPDLASDVKFIRGKLSNQTGFIAGVAATASALMALAGAVLLKLWDIGSG